MKYVIYLSDQYFARTCCYSGTQSCKERNRSQQITFQIHSTTNHGRSRFFPDLGLYIVEWHEDPLITKWEGWGRNFLQRSLRCNPVILFEEQITVVQMSEQLVLRTPPEQDAGVVYPLSRLSALIRIWKFAMKNSDSWWLTSLPQWNEYVHMACFLYTNWQKR